MAQEDAVVGLAHSKRQDLSDADVLALVRSAVDEVGGIGNYVNRGDVVLLKPNQTLWFLAENGVTTDPRVVGAMVTLCKEAGAGHIVVGDSSGGDLKSKNTLEITGIKRIAEDAGADEVVGLEDVEQEDIEVEIDGERRTMKVPKIAVEAQAIINLPKAKTHFEDLISCCLKNYVGVMYQKTRPTWMSDPLLFKATAALHDRLPTTLNVVDGLWAGEGTGPAANEGVWLGCVAAGADPVAVDTVIADLMGLDPAGLKFAKAAADIGVGVHDRNRITVRGANPDDVRIRVEPAKLGLDHIPANILIGEDVTWAGSLGHFKSIAETFLKFGFWDVINRVYGRTTFMIGRVEDPNFEENVKKGPYFVIDDAALDKYRTDRRVTFIPGHPATHNIFPYIWRTLNVQNLGPKAMKMKGVMDKIESFFNNPSWDAEAGEGGPVKRGELQ